MTSHQDVDENVKITEFQDAVLPQQEELDSIMETLEGMESKFKSSFQEIDEAFRDLNIKIDEGNGRFNGLVNEILTNFDDFERKREPPKLGLMMRRMVSTYIKKMCLSVKNGAVSVGKIKYSTIFSLIWLRQSKLIESNDLEPIWTHGLRRLTAWARKGF